MVHYFKKALAGLFLLLCFSNANAKILLVNDIGDSGPNTLRGRIGAALSGDTVMMNVKGTINLASPIAITNKAITILGAFPIHSIIDCSGLGSTESAFDINGTGGGLLTIQGFTIKNYGQDVSAIYIQGTSQVKIMDCLFEDNIGFYNGQCIASFIGGGLVEIYNCSFIGNSSTNGGGAIYLSNQAKVRNCTFFQNTTTAGSNGGAIYSDGNISVSNCTFLNNTAAGSGGSIYQGSGSIELFNNIFSSTNVANELSGNTWSNLGGNVFSGAPGPGINQYAGGNISGGPGDQFTTGFANIGMNGTPTTDGYGLVYFRLISGSPCIDNGVNPGAGSLLPTDCKRAPRVLNGTGAATPLVDAGAVEFTPHTVTGNTAATFLASWVAMDGSSFSGPKYMDFNIAGVGPFVFNITTALNNTNSSGVDWIVDGFTQNGSAIPGPGAVAGTVTPGVYSININYGAADVITLTSPGANNWISGLWIDNASSSTNAITINGGGTTKIFGNHIISSFGTSNSPKTGINAIGTSTVIVGGMMHHFRNVIGGQWYGIYCQNFYDLIQGNFIGTTADGLSTLPNQIGVFDDGTQVNIIGKYKYPSMNLVSGNSAAQIEISSLGVFNIHGNIIGPDYTTQNLLTNTAPGIYAGPNTDGAIGTGMPGDFNVIGGNAEGILLSSANNVTVLGNFIGISPEIGFPVIPNNNGVVIVSNGDANHLIGDGTFGGRNFISGNSNLGIYVNTDAYNHIINGNFIGLKPDNSLGGNGLHGIYVIDNSYNLNITGNVIGGNSGDGIRYEGAGNTDLIQLNKIGTDSTGNVAIANDKGIHFDNAGPDILVSNNQISGNTLEGILVENTNNLLGIDNNIIGLDASLNNPVANQRGIVNQLGSNLMITNNTIASNFQYGIQIADASGFVIRNNFIGTNSSLTPGIGNGLSGIHLSGSANNGIIGGTLGEANTIAFNNQSGISTGPAVSLVGFLSNSIYDNGDLGISLTNSTTPLANDVNDGDATGTYGNAGQNYPDNLVVSSCAGSTVLTGDIDVSTAGNYLIQVFKINPGAVDPTGHGEGNTFMYETTLNFPSAGPNTINFPLPGTIVLGDILSLTTTYLFSGTQETSEFSDTVIVRGGFTPTATVTSNVTCFGGSDGVVTVTVSGGVGPFTYNWYNSSATTVSTSQTASGLPAGDYYCDVIDGSNSCVISSNLVTITEPAQLVATASSTNALCAGSCDGTIVITESGGTPSYQYSIDNGISYFATNTFSSLCAGSYQFVVIDGNGCLTPNTGNFVNVNEPSALSVSPTVTDETCDGADDGSITLTVAGGTPGYLYQIDGLGFGASSTFSSLPDGNHTYDVVDGNGCTVNGNITINQGEIVTADFSFNNGCQGAPVINFTDLSSASSSTISSWNWTFPAGTSPSTTSILQNPTGNTFITPGINNVSLTVVSGNGCTANSSQNVTIYPAVVADAGVDDAICFGDPFTQNASVTLGTAPYIISWNPPVDFDDFTLQNPSILTAPPISSGVHTYTMNVTDANGCTSTDQMILTINALPTVDAGTPQSVCQTGSVSVTLSGSGASSYTWDNSVSDGVAFTPTVTTLYTVTGTDGNGCQSTDTVTIIVDAPPTVNAGADLDECRTTAFMGNLNGIVTNAASVLWTTSGIGTWSPDDLSATTGYIYSGADVSSSFITLTLTAYSGNSCPDVSDDLIVTFHDAPDAYAGLDATICLGTPIALNGSAVNYLSIDWTNGTGIFNPDNISLNTNYTPSVAEISAGFVDLVLTAYSTNPACPNDDDTITFTLITPPDAEAGLDVTICNGQSYTLDGTGSTGTISSYSWDDVGGTNVGTSNTATVSPTVTMDYVLTVSGPFCSDDDTVTITVVAAPDASFNYPAAQYCADAGVQSPMNVMTAGGVFSLPGFSTSINAVTGDLDPGTLPPGNYTVYYTLSTPCTAVDSVSVTINALPDATINGTINLCVGSGAVTLNTNSTLFPVTTLTGGTFSGPGVGSGIFTPSTAGSGSHIITYSVTDGNGCSNSDTALIVVNPSPTASVSGVSANYCETDPIFTPIGTPSGGVWIYDSSPFGSSLSVDPDTVSNGLHSINYQYTDPSTGCSITTLPTGFNVYAVPLDPITTQPTSQTICSGGSLSLVVSNPNGSGTSLAWYADAALTNQLAFGPTYNTPALFASVQYYVVVQNSGCKSDPIIFDITVNTTGVDAGSDITICPGTPAQLNVTFTSGTVLWSPGASLSDSAIQNPIATPNVNTTYYVTVTNGPCVDMDSVNVIIDGSNPDCGIMPSYNAFSPDGDGVNDVWVIDAAALHPDNKLTIFNRWGDKLVELEDYDNVNVVWDGTYNGNLLPSGTYFYVIEYLDINIQVSGWMQITH